MDILGKELSGTEARRLYPDLYPPVFAAVDVETTGLENIHEIWEIAVLPFELKKDVGACGTYTFKVEPLEIQFKSRIQPFKPVSIDAEALKVCNITKEEILNAPNVMQVFRSFIEWRDDAFFNQLFIPVGHAYDSFDREFITRCFIPRGRYNEIFTRNCFDTKHIANWLRTLGKISCESTSLDVLAPMYGLDKLYCRHTAYGDAMISMKLFEIFLNTK